MPPRQRLPLLGLPLPTGVLALVAAVFVLPGLASHDLWKSHDAIGLGIVHGMATSGELLVPRVAGVPWMLDGPLYHWIALGFGKALDSLIEFHAAARFASGACMLLAFWLVYQATRRWSPPEEGRLTAAAAVLLLLGSTGLIVHAHEALPELAALAAMCGGLATLPYAIRRPLSAGVAFGAALGAAVLSSTWVAPGALGVAALATALVSPQWRQKRGAAFLVAATAASLLVSLSWPLALALESPDAFLEWWTLAWRPEATPLENLRYLLVTGSWFAWPAWPLALWTLWALRRRWREPRVLVPALGAALMLAGLALWGEARDVSLIPLLAPLAVLASQGVPALRGGGGGGARGVSLIPLLAPLAVLAAQGVPALRRGAAAALDWFGVLAFAFFTALLWLGWVAMITGLPPKIADNFARAAPGFAPQFEFFPFLAALALLAAWLYVVFYTAPSPLRALTRWATGIVLLWGTFAMLLMPWADYQKSYRPVALQLRSKLPVGAGCIAGKALGMPQAAALDYHGGIRTEPFDPLRPRECSVILVQGHPRDEFDAPGAGWVKLADVGRPGDRSERLRLYALEK